MSLSILDLPLPKLGKAIRKCSLGELEALLEAEKNGKTRKGAIALLEAAIADAEPAEVEPVVEGADVEEIAAKPVAPQRFGYETVENIVPGLDITLHDNSHLLFGESASVPAELAEILRGRGQVR